jgi:hypothetical protein
MHEKSYATIGGKKTPGRHRCRWEDNIKIYRNGV